MASIYKHGRGWRAQVSIRGARESATFRTKQEASAWALEREAELSGAKLPDRTLADALARYGREVAPLHKGERWELLRIAVFARHPLARRALAGIDRSDVTDWREARSLEVAAGSVRREMILLQSVFAAALDWGWLRTNPVAGVKKPSSPASRKRRITADEIDRITLACGLDDLEADTASQRTGLAFLFALETAMRAGEIVGMMWHEVGEKSVTLPRTKNGDVRKVPLSMRAREILAALPVTDGPVFNLDPGTRDVMFRRARDAAEVVDLRFHDSRAEAIWRLSKKLDVMELARVIGHRDLRSLMIYYQVDADELADRL